MDDDGKSRPHAWSGSGWWVGSLCLLLACLYATSFSSHVALGDAPESVAGVSSLGVAHAPGYTVYLAAARLFTLLLPVGELAWRVNAFSSVCTISSAVLVFGCARLCGASRTGATIGALSFGTGASVWYYATFAKHDAFTLLLAVAVMFLALGWATCAGWWRLALLGALLGLSIGAGWYATAVVAPGVALVVVGSSSMRLRDAGLIVVPFLVVAAAVAGYTIARASSDPAVNWGNATTVGRYVDLVLMEDFRGRSALAGLDSTSRNTVEGSDVTALPARLFGYLNVVQLDLGVGALLLAAVGAFSTWRRRSWPLPTLLVVVAATNLLAVALLLGMRPVGWRSVLQYGGFLGPLMTVVGIWAAVGATSLLDTVYRWWMDQRRHGSSSRRAPSVGAALLATGLLLPALTTRSAFVSQPPHPLADSYATAVLEELPPNAVLVVFGADRAFPIQYRQTVHGDRRDVVTVAADGLAADWYIEELSQSLDTGLSEAPGPLQAVSDLVTQLDGRRPVYLDMSAAQVLSGTLGYIPRGLTAEVVEDGIGEQRASTEGESALHIERARSLAGHPGVGATEARSWPSRIVMNSYGQAIVFASNQAGWFGDTDAQRALLVLVLEIQPDNLAAQEALDLLGGAPERGS